MILSDLSPRFQGHGVTIDALDKVAGVCASTVPVGCELRLFTPVPSADVVELVTNSARATCFLHGCWSSPSKSWLRSCVDCSTGPYNRAALFRRRSSSPTLCRYWRKQIWIRPTPSRIDRFPTYPLSLSCWNDWSIAASEVPQGRRSASRPSVGVLNASLDGDWRS